MHTEEGCWTTLSILPRDRYRLSGGGRRGSKSPDRRCAGKIGADYPPLVLAFAIYLFLRTSQIVVRSQELWVAKVTTRREGFYGRHSATSYGAASLHEVYARLVFKA
ncbi:hypothetical protein AVEN_104172-1 [Araneus ventricosus]|uniref:Uncharacterized protein n=1 Tax=Araneus ventricosus TaxID=182803 RepID=A0A4Y2E0C6_ARAVE|nr:hypothetical protein AVEN_104172-1 [Araneus ventricosus]